MGDPEQAAPSEFRWLVLKRGAFDREKELWRRDDLLPEHVRLTTLHNGTGFYLGIRWYTSPEKGGPFRLWLILDFDGDTLPDSLREALKFVERVLEPAGFRDPWDFVVYYSGGTGLHIHIQHLTPPGEEWPWIWRAKIEKWREEFPSLDPQVATGTTIRAPLSKHFKPKGGGTGIRKVPLTLSDLDPERAEWIVGFAKRLTDKGAEDLAKDYADLFLPDPGAETPPHVRKFFATLKAEWVISRAQAAQRASVVARKVRPEGRGLEFWLSLLEGAGIGISKVKPGEYIRLERCPYAGGEHRGRSKCIVRPNGWLYCASTKCVANRGLPPEEWLRDLGIPLPEEGMGEEPIPDPPPPLPEPKDVLPLEEARRRLEEVVEEAMWEAVEEGKSSLVRATPGLGKSKIALEKAARYSRRGYRIIYTSITRNLACENYLRYRREHGDNARLLEPRSEKNCPNFRRASLLAERGYWPGRYLCPWCEHRSKCAYWRQLEDTKGKVIFCTHEQGIYLILGDRLKADVIVFDESPQRLLLEEHQLTRSMCLILSERNGGALSRLAKVLLLALDLAARQTSRDGKKLALRRAHFVDLLEAVAEGEGYDLLSLVEEARSEAKEKISPSKVAGMDEEEIASLPPAWLHLFLEDLKGEIEHRRQKLEEARRWAEEARRLEAEGRVEEAREAREKEREAKRKAGEWNHRVVLVANGSGEARIVFRRRLPLPPEPFLILDAYGSRKLYEALTGRQVEGREVWARIEGEVVQIKRRASKAAFSDSRARKGLYLELEKIIEMCGGKRVLLVTHREEEVASREFLKEHGRKVAPPLSEIEEGEMDLGPYDAAVIHFWQGRGIDAFRRHDFDAVIVFGEPFPNPWEAFDECCALYAEDPEPISPLVHPSDRKRYMDPRLATYIGALREAEVVQSVFRVDILSTENTRAFVIGRLPIPGVETEEFKPGGLDGGERERVVREFIGACLREVGFYCHLLAEDAGLKAEKAHNQALNGAGSKTRMAICGSTPLKRNVLLNGMDPQVMKRVSEIGPIPHSSYVRLARRLLPGPGRKVAVQAGGRTWVFKVWGDVDRAREVLRVAIGQREATSLLPLRPSWFRYVEERRRWWFEFEADVRPFVRHVLGCMEWRRRLIRVLSQALGLEDGEVHRKLVALPGARLVDHMGRSFWWTVYGIGDEEMARRYEVWRRVAGNGRTWTGPLVWPPPSQPWALPVSGRSPPK